jgi:hypothetical protein
MVDEAYRGLLMTKRSALALCVIALISSLAFPNRGVAQGKSLKALVRNALPSYIFCYWP